MKVRDLFSLMLRNVMHDWWRHLSLIAIIALATALITGALILGTCVRSTLEDAAWARTGQLEHLLHPQRSWVDQDVAQRLKGEGEAIIHVQAFTYDAEGLPVKLNLYGVQAESFFPFVYGVESDELPSRQFWASAESLQKLGMKEGESLSLRLPLDAHYAEGLAWSLNEQEMQGLRCPVHRSDKPMGFQLHSGEAQGITLFVSRDTLASVLEKEGKANRILVKGSPLLQASARLDDYALQLKPLPQGGCELTHEQSFIPDAIAQSLSSLSQQPRQRIFTYFVNEIKCGEKSAPYSFISGMSRPLGAELAADECTLTQWLADDMGLKVGDEMTISYYEIEAMGSLSTATASLRVKDIIPTADRRDLTPPFPGFTDSDSCTDWDPSVPVDTESIRPQDEQYWEDYQGSPKLFVKLETAQKLFGSAQGNLSALRFDAVDGAQLEQALAQHIKLFQAIPLKAENEQGVQEALDFSGLFLALSFIIIIAAIVLLHLIAKLKLQSKAYELSLLRSLGYSRAQLTGLLLAEYALYAFVGCSLGFELSLAYVAGILALLNSLWNSISGYALISFDLSLLDVLIGLGAGFVISMMSITLLARQLLKDSLSQHLQEDFSQQIWRKRDRLQAFLFAGLTMVIAAYNVLVDGGQNLALHFTSSFLLLLLALKLCRGMLYRWQGRLSEQKLCLKGLALRNLTRNIKRSMGMITVMSMGMYICLLTILNHRQMGDDAAWDSGTGGFYGIIESSIPIKLDLNTMQGREQFHLEGLGEQNKLIQLKKIEGAQAGCLNLNRVTRPQVLGVPKASLQGRFRLLQEGAHWGMLESAPDSKVIPVIADAEVIQWSLGLKLGDTLDYTAPSGEHYQLQFVASLDKSIFQGYVLMSQQNLERLAPQVVGSSWILVDYPLQEKVLTLTQAIERHGVCFLRASQQLNRYNQVQNTYLSIFFALGSLGMLMGIGGSYLIGKHQKRERRAELRLLHYCGYSQRQIAWLLRRESLILFELALATCIIAIAYASLVI